MSVRNCKLSLCEMLVLLRFDFARPAVGGGRGRGKLRRDLLYLRGRAAKRIMFLKQVNAG